MNACAIVLKGSADKMSFKHLILRSWMNADLHILNMSCFIFGVWSNVTPGILNNWLNYIQTAPTCITLLVTADTYAYICMQMLWWQDRMCRGQTVGVPRIDSCKILKRRPNGSEMTWYRYDRNQVSTIILSQNTRSCLCRQMLLSIESKRADRSSNINDIAFRSSMLRCMLF